MYVWTGDIVWRFEYVCSNKETGERREAAPEGEGTRITEAREDGEEKRTHAQRAVEVRTAMIWFHCWLLQHRETTTAVNRISVCHGCMYIRVNQSAHLSYMTSSLLLSPTTHFLILPQVQSISLPLLFSSLIMTYPLVLFTYPLTAHRKQRALRRKQRKAVAAGNFRIKGEELDDREYPASGDVDIGEPLFPSIFSPITASAPIPSFRGRPVSSKHTNQSIVVQDRYLLRLGKQCYFI